jgi:transcriptional regulator
MYLPPQFDAKDRAHALTLMREHPFASLISTDEQGLPFVTHLPLKAEAGEGGAFTLLGHVARGNPHARYLQQRPRAVVTFLGGHAYMSPSVYPDLQRVPTWNYVAVHCTVEARLLDDPQAKDALLKKLIADHEPSYAAQWRSLGDDYAQKMLSAIVAFELRVTELQCKLKLNQHRPEAHAAMHAGYITGSESERELATWMERLGLDAR